MQGTRRDELRPLTQSTLDAHDINVPFRPRLPFSVSQEKQEKALLGCVVESSENLLPDREAQLVRKLYHLRHPAEQRRSGKGCSRGGGWAAGQPEALLVVTLGKGQRRELFTDGSLAGRSLHI